MNKADIIPVITEIAGLVSGTNATLQTALAIVTAVQGLANMFLKKRKQELITDDDTIAAMRAGFELNRDKNDTRIAQLEAFLTERKKA